MNTDQAPSAASRGSEFSAELGPLQTYVPDALHALMRAVDEGTGAEDKFYAALSACQRAIDAAVAAQRNTLLKALHALRSAARTTTHVDVLNECEEVIAAIQNDTTI